MKCVRVHRRGRGWAMLGVLAVLAAVLAVAGSAPAAAQARTCLGEKATIVAKAGQVTVGTSGDDVIVGTSGPDDISGGGGDDLICGFGGGDVLRGNAGNDQIWAGGGADRVFGGKGRDVIIGGNGDDDLHGNSGRDTIRGRAGSDQISGGKGDDTIFGGADDDTIAGNGNRDTISGGKGDDTISGGNKGDVLRGRSGDDTIFGNRGQDVLVGNQGRDDLRGGKAWDRCSGGSGKDSFSSCDPSSPFESRLTSNVVARVNSVGGTASVGSDVIVTPDGKPFIAMRDVVGLPGGGEEGSVRLIRCKDASCGSVTETSRDPGRPSLAVGPNGRPVLSVSPIPGVVDKPSGVLVACENARCTKFTETDDVEGSLAVAPDGTTYLATQDETTACDDPTCPDAPTTLNIGGLIAVGEDGLPFFGQELFGQERGRISVVECLDAACSVTEDTVLEDTTAGEGFLPGPAGGPNGPASMVYRLQDPADAEGTSTELVLNVWDDDPAARNRVTLATGQRAGSIFNPLIAAAVGADERPVVMWARRPLRGHATVELVVARCDDRSCDTGTMATVLRGPLQFGFHSVAVGDDGLPVFTYGVRAEGLTGAKTVRATKCADVGCTNGALDLATWDTSSG